MHQPNLVIGCDRDDVRAEIARASAEAERSALAGFSQDEVKMLRRMLFEIIGDSEDPGSCL